MRFIETQLEGVRLIEPRIFRDDRGFFLESFREDRFREAGILHPFVQDNHSHSRGGTIRALHYQSHPGQAKLVRVVRGRVYDVTVDLRRSSTTFGRWQGFELDDEHCRMLYIPVGFAHGFAVLSAEADFVYRVSSYYDPAAERGLRWDDPEIGVVWPVDEPVLSERDRRNPTLGEVKETLPDW